MRTTTNIVGLGLVCLSMGCVADDAPLRDMAEPDVAEGAHISVLGQVPGTWLEERPFVDDVLTARCDRCAFAVKHEIALRDDELVDSAVVLVVHSFDDKIPAGTALCSRERAYVTAVEQPFSNGELLDYELIRDTCAESFAPAVLEGYALWVPSATGALFEVMEDVPPPGTVTQGYRPFARWTRMPEAIASTRAP